MDWNKFLDKEANKDYFINLQARVQKERNNYTIYPKEEDVFNAFTYTPFDSVKVVILGQDPYPGANQAMGLSFSVPDEVAIPPSLRNIFKEVEDDLSIQCYDSGNLIRWTRQGVFLLNNTLTVRAGLPNSHEFYGWDIFTDNVIKELNVDKTPKVFLLWGANARRKKELITNRRHLILESYHPSPLSAYRGFFGNKHFSKANEFLTNHKRDTIDWR